MQSSTVSSLAENSVHKRKAGGDMTIGTPAKMGRRRDIIDEAAGGTGTAPSLFNEVNRELFFVMSKLTKGIVTYGGVG